MNLFSTSSIILLSIILRLGQLQWSLCQKTVLDRSQRWKECYGTPQWNKATMWFMDDNIVLFTHTENHSAKKGLKIKHVLETFNPAWWFMAAIAIQLTNRINKRAKRPMEVTGCVYTLPLSFLSLWCIFTQCTLLIISSLIGSHDHKLHILGLPHLFSFFEDFVVFSLSNQGVHNFSVPRVVGLRRSNLVQRCSSEIVRCVFRNTLYYHFEETLKDIDFFKP